MPWRRWVMGALLAMGAVTTAFLVSAIVGGRVGATIDGHHIGGGVTRRRHRLAQVKR